MKTLARDRRTLRVCACVWDCPSRLQDFVQGLCKIFSRNSPFSGDKIRAQIHPKITPKSTKMAPKRVPGPLGGGVGKKATNNSEKGRDLNLQTGTFWAPQIREIAIFWQRKKATRTQLLRTSVFRQGSVTGPISGRSGPPF